VTDKFKYLVFCTTSETRPAIGKIEFPTDATLPIAETVDEIVCVAEASVFESEGEEEGREGI